MKKNDYPIRLTMDDYNDESKVEKLWYDIIIPVLIIGISVVVIINNERWPIYVLVAGLVLAAILMIYDFINHTRAQKHSKKIEKFFEEGRTVEGVYVNYCIGQESRKKVYNKNLEEFEVYERVPHKYYSPTPICCRAYVVNNEAIVYELISDVKGYRSSEEYVVAVVEKRKQGGEAKHGK